MNLNMDKKMLMYLTS